MKKSQKDIFNFDYLSLFVKNNNFHEVKDAYLDFGWRYVEHQQDLIYENVQEVHFKRPHKIENKDELQFLQVGLDNTLVKKGQLDKRKHTLSVICGLTLGLISALLIILPIILKCNYSVFNAWTLSLGILGVVLTLFSIFVTINIFKREKIKYESSMQELGKKIREYRKKARTLLGGNPHERI